MVIRPRTRAAPPAVAAQHGSLVGFHNKLDTPMVRLGPDDLLYAGNLFEGVQIFGGTGSGKSSGSARAIALAMLQAGWGGLVLCAKPDESRRWEEYCRIAGRSAHFVHITPNGPFRYNFLNHEAHRPDGAGRDAFFQVHLIEFMMDATAVALGPAAGGDGAPFWIMSRREMLANAIEPLIAANGQLRLDELMQMVASAPTSREEAFSEAWKSSYCYQTLQRSYEAPLGPPLTAKALKVATDYWFGTFANLDPKTRSNIVATLTSAISPFLRGVLHEMFCTSTSVLPEMTHEGAILVLDLPVKVWGAAAVVAAQLYKYQWQKATERRPVGPHTRPVFAFADESQFYVSEHDPEFQSTARSALAATLYITQNLPTYYACMRGRDPKAATDSLLGNFQTKIFHANTDPTTNQYAADLIGKSIQRRGSENWSANESRQTSIGSSKSWGEQRGTSESANSGTSSGFGFTVDHQGNVSRSANFSTSEGRQKGSSQSTSIGGGTSSGRSYSTGESSGGGWSEQMDYTVQPAVFAAGMRKGGTTDAGLVDGMLVQGGRRFQETGAHWLPVTFQQ